MTKMKMNTITPNKKVLKLAKQAGFIVWEENDYAPERAGLVDWACEYDQELVKFYRLVRDDLMKELEQNGRLRI